MGRARSFDDVAERYDRTRAIPDPAARAIVAAIAGELATVARPARLLEVGVGTGRVAVPLAAAGVRVVGVEVSRNMLARLAAKAHAVQVVLADAAALPLRGVSVDAALFVHVLHLVPDPAAVVRGARAVVRPGGRLLLGQTEYGDDLRRRAIDLLWTTIDAIGGPRRPPDRHAASAAAFESVAAEAGGRTESAPVARWTERRSGRSLLADLAARTYSSTWAIPDALMPELLTRYAPSLEALLGDLDRPFDFEASFTLTRAQIP